MFPRNRLSYMVLAAAMATTLLFTTEAFADDGQGALDFVPEDTMMVFAIDVEQVRTTDLFKEFMAAVEKEPEAKEGLKMLKESAGFDPQKDLSSVVIALPPDVEKTENFLMIAKGKFDEKKFIAFAEKEGGQKFASATHQGLNYYQMDDGAIAFSGDYLVVGSTAALKAALDTQKGKMGSVKKNKTVSAHLKAVDTKSDVWFSVNLPAEIQEKMAKENPMVRDIEAAHGSIDLGSGLKVRLNLGTKSADTAKSLVDLANAGLREAGSDAQLKAMGLDAVVTNLKVTNADKEVVVKLDLNEAEFGRVVSTIKQLTGGL